MNHALDDAREQLRAALARCPKRPPDLERRAESVLGLLDTAGRLGRGHGAAIAEAVAFLVELERLARATQRQGELFEVEAAEQRLEQFERGRLK